MDARNTATADTADTEPWAHTDGLWEPPPDPYTGLLELAEYETDAAWHAGYAHACADIAGRHAELAAVWKATGRASYQQKVAERIAGMEACAAAWHAQHGTREWAGLDNGATLPSADWHTTTVTTIHHGRAA